MVISLPSHLLSKLPSSSPSPKPNTTQKYTLNTSTTATNNPIGVTPSPLPPLDTVHPDHNCSATTAPFAKKEEGAPSLSIAANGVGRKCYIPPIPKPLTNPNPIPNSNPNPTSTIINQLQDTAEAAIADTFLQRGKRSHSEISETPSNSNIANETKEGTGNKWQTKRKKKPRKEDCEVRLKKLKAENEMLKRHLDHVTNKSNRFEKERKLAEEKMKVLFFSGQKEKNGGNSVGDSAATKIKTEGDSDGLQHGEGDDCGGGADNDDNGDGDDNGDCDGDNDDDNNSTSTTGEHSLNSKSSFTDREEKLKDILKHFSNTYSDYGKHRQEELTFHLSQLEKLAAPTTFTKMTLWTLGQNESFFTQPQSNPIAGILRREMDITPAQGRKIIAQRETIQRLCNNIKSCLQLIAELKALCARKQTVFHERMTKCQEILTTEQVAKLLIWIDDHGAVLEKVCPGWGSERIQSGKKGRGGSGSDGEKKIGGGVADS